MIKIYVNQIMCNPPFNNSAITNQLAYTIVETPFNISNLQPEPPHPKRKHEKSFEEKKTMENHKTLKNLEGKR